MPLITTDEFYNLTGKSDTEIYRDMLEGLLDAASGITSVNAVIPASVKNMEASFRNCFRMNGNIEVNAANLTNYSNCFVNTCRDDGSVTLTGSCPLLAELAATDTNGKVTVATA